MAGIYDLRALNHKPYNRNIPNPKRLSHPEPQTHKNPRITILDPQPPKSLNPRKCMAAPAFGVAADFGLAAAMALAAREAWEEVVFLRTQCTKPPKHRQPS